MRAVVMVYFTAFSFSAKPSSLTLCANLFRPSTFRLSHSALNSAILFSVEERRQLLALRPRGVGRDEDADETGDEARA
jgi:hypothetical protein